MWVSLEQEQNVHPTLHLCVKSKQPGLCMYVTVCYCVKNDKRHKHTAQHHVCHPGLGFPEGAVQWKLD